ncbi:MAG TPA: CAP domain-containing protein [Archangium sp.]|nr:CAP domain-containing protein [Archangium sp.]
MKPTKFRLLVLWLASLTAGAAGCGTSEAATKPATSASTSLAAEMVAAHNQARAKAKPKPSSALPPLTWSPEAAKVAQAYANRCEFEHNKNRGKQFGENLAAAAPPGSKTNAQVVEDWVSEVADYAYATNKCAPGKACGHYTPPGNFVGQKPY